MSPRRLRPAWLVLAFGLVGCGRSVAPPVAVPAVQSGKPVEQPAAVAAPKLSIQPAEVRIAPGDPGVQLLATFEPSPGSRRDVSGSAKWRVEPAGVLAVDGSGFVRSLQEGTATVEATVEGETVLARVTAEPLEQRPWDFGEDVVPILTRAGCNTGGCHGRGDGQNGFHLSLFGYDPDGDYQAITRDAGGRRVSLLRPEESLFLGKAAGRIPHGGGPRVGPDSTEYRTILAWLSAGAPRKLGKIHGPIAGLAVEPSEVRLGEPGPRQLRVVARYADGHTRDVTRLASYRSNDDATLTVGQEGNAVLQRRGEADLVVRYQSQVVSTRVSAIVNKDLDLDFSKLRRRNFIDDELFKRLESLKVPPSPPAGDAAFLRRASLDLTGQQPTPEQVRQFLADTDPEKRVKLVDLLIRSPEFTLFWRIKFGDMLQISTARFGNGASYYHTWVKEQLDQNAPWDKTVRTLLTALGNPTVQGGGPVNYALDGPDAQTRAEQSAQRFLALRVRCAQCHDHPFDVWTQDDYFGLAAFFARAERVGGAGAMSGRAEVKLNPKGEVQHLRTKKPSTPKLLGGPIITVAEDADPRKALADWITAPDNPYFARATANWVWAQFFGKGLADPPDDLSRSNPPVHPELLDALARHFVAHNFDLRDLIRTVATSEAYGLSSGTVTGNESDTRLFSHQVPRPLTAHQMADALAQATDVPNRYPNKPAGSRAIDVYDPATASAVLDTFGRCPRTVGCSSVSSPVLSLRQSLLLLGGDVIEGKVSSLNGYLANLLELNPSPDEVVENLYLRTLCRPPTAEELSRWSAELKGSASTREASEDLFWALLNSREFAFNH